MEQEMFVQKYFGFFMPKKCSKKYETNALKWNERYKSLKFSVKAKCNIT